MRADRPETTITEVKAVTDDETRQLCPNCEGLVEIDLQEIEIGAIFECPACGAELVISNDMPPEFDLVVFGEEADPPGEETDGVDA